MFVKILKLSNVLSTFSFQTLQEIFLLIFPVTEQTFRISHDSITKHAGEFFVRWKQFLQGSSMERGKCPWVLTAGAILLKFWKFSQGGNLLSSQIFYCHPWKASYGTDIHNWLKYDFLSVCHLISHEEHKLENKIAKWKRMVRKKFSHLNPQYLSKIQTMFYKGLQLWFYVWLYLLWNSSYYYDQVKCAKFLCNTIFSLGQNFEWNFF